MPFIVLIIVERAPCRPAIIGLPGQVAALKQKIGRPVVTYNKDKIRLVSAFQRGQFAQIDPTQPILRNRNQKTLLPAALYNVMRPVFWGGLSLAWQRPQRHDSP